jgi:hypothetical protein
LMMEAAYALSRNGSKKAQEAIIDHYQASEGKEREVLLEALPTSSPRAKEILLSAVNDSNVEISTRAARLLVDRGGKDVKTQLVSLLQSSQSKELRRSLAQSFRQEGGKTYRENKELIESLLKQDQTEIAEP